MSLTPNSSITDKKELFIVGRLFIFSQQAPETILFKENCLFWLPKSNDSLFNYYVYGECGINVRHVNENSLFAGKHGISDFKST